MFKQVHPERTYNTFEEADAAADAEVLNAYNGGADVTRKSAFKGTSASKQPADAFARVTWTDLAMGRQNEASGRAISRQGGRSSAAGGGLAISPSVANFSLAVQQHNDDVEEIKNAMFEEPEKLDDENAPQTYKANFVRRNTVLR